MALGTVLVGQASSTLPSKDPPAWLADLALQESKASGDPEPASGEWALTDAATVAKVLGPGDGDGSVEEYLVVLTGHFQANSAFLPSSEHEPPAGTTLVLVIDHAQVVQDFGIVPGDIDTSAVDRMYSFDPSDSDSSPSPTSAPNS